MWKEPDLYLLVGKMEGDTRGQGMCDLSMWDTVAREKQRFRPYNLKELHPANNPKDQKINSPLRTSRKEETG